MVYEQRYGLLLLQNFYTLYQKQGIRRIRCHSLLPLHLSNYNWIKDFTRTVTDSMKRIWFCLCWKPLSLLIGHRVSTPFTPSLPFFETVSRPPLPPLKCEGRRVWSKRPHLSESRAWPCWNSGAQDYLTPLSTNLQSHFRDGSRKSGDSTGKLYPTK